MFAIALWVRSIADAAKAKKPPDFWVFESPRVRAPPDGCEDKDCCGRCRLPEAEEAEEGGGDGESLSATGSRGECRRGEVAGVEKALLLLLGLRLGRD